MRKNRLLLILAVILPLLSGCFSISMKRMSGPVHSHGAAQVRRTQFQPAWIVHYLPKTADFNLDLCVANTRNWLRVDFLFYVLPFPEWSERNDYYPNYLAVEMEIDPKGGTIEFDPSRIFYSATNQVRVAPAHAWAGIPMTDPLAIVYQNFDLKRQMRLAVTNVTSPTWFYLEYNVDDSPDRRFDLMLDGLTIDGRTNSLGTMHFKPVSIFRPEFMLPY